MTKVTRPSPRGFHRAEMLFVATALLAFVFAVLARSAIRLPLGTRLDQGLELRIHGWVSGPVLALLRCVSFFGSTIFIVAGSIVVSIVLWRIKAPRRLRAFLLSIAGAVLWVQLLKQFFHRGRPDLFDPLARALGFSFPSGHSALSAGFFGSIAGLAAASSKSRRQAVHFLTLGVGMVFLVGFSRVALGVHWPTDVLAGWSVGFGWLAFIFAVAERQARQARRPPAAS